MHIGMRCLSCPDCRTSAGDVSLCLLLPDLLRSHRTIVECTSVLDLVLRVESSDIYGSSAANLGTGAGLLDGGATEPSQVN